MVRYMIFTILCLTLWSCQSDKSAKVHVIEDLPFAHSKEAKIYADLILKAIRTNRPKVLFDQFGHEAALNRVQFNRIASMYSTGISGREDWEFHDFHQLGGRTDQSKSFHYAWLDPHGRLGLQIYINTGHNGSRYYIENIDFRSRLEVMESISFPSGNEIEDYFKIPHSWN